jgi:DNA repair protein RecO (recombination protein O)
MPAEESTPAIVLRARDYADSDRIVTLLTRDAGKLSGIAKGAKASRHRFERKLEPF